MLMKMLFNQKVMTLLAASSLALSVSAQCNFTIHGNLQNAEGKKVYLYYGDQMNPTIDSVVVANNKFSFKGELDAPFENGTLVMGNPRDYMNTKSWSIALEPLTITLSGDANKKNEVIIQGGKVQDDLNQMTHEMEIFEKPLERLNKEYYAQGKEGRDSLLKLMEPYQKQYAAYIKNFMQTHTNSFFATKYLAVEMGRMPYEEIKAIWDKLSPEVQKYGVMAKDVKSELDVLAKVRPGSPAPDFTATDFNGMSFTLSSLKGKVVIIDFWASWCVPCRKSNPHMRELYAKYHQKGLDLVYVADDDSKPDKWKAAVEKDQLVGEGYHHVLRGLKVDLEKRSFDKTNDISDKYAIHFLPTKYLIDKKGNVVCKISEGEDTKLDALIEKLLAE